MRSVWILLTGFVVAGPVHAVPQNAEAVSLEHAVRDIRGTWGDPGVVITIVKDGRVLLQRGYGDTKLSGGQPVTPSTLVSVASVTKTVNSVAIAMLVADGAIRWNDPVRSVIPEFRFVDEYRTESTTIQDLITHRAGLPAVIGDIRSLDYPMTDLLHELPSREPRIAFRERVDYSQVGIALLGEIVARASGTSWSHFVRTRILEPLGMASTYAGTLAFLEVYPEPQAVPHLMGRLLRREGEYVAGEWRGVGNIYTPAGGMISTGEDMSRFMRFVLSGGTADGRSLLDSALIAELHEPRGVEGSPYGPVVSPFGGLVAYCMGWIAHDFEGHRVVEHPGSNFGSSVVALVPDAGVGVFVSTAATYSLDSDRLVSALKFAALSYALGITQRDWMAVFASDQ